MKISENKIKHCLSVANIMKDIALKKYPKNPQFAEDMFTLGLVHDIGYEFSDLPMQHAHVGGELLKRQGYEYWEEVYNHGDCGTDYHSEALDILNTADLYVGPDGTLMTMEERLMDIEKRYGFLSEQYQSSLRIYGHLNRRTIDEFMS